MNSSNLNWSVDFYQDNVDECNAFLNSLEDFDRIPLLNSFPLHYFSDGSLVRYQGMVQDMLNPEYYSSSYTVFNKEKNESFIKSGKFRDVTYCKANEELQLKDSNFEPKERLVFFCVPMPGTNDWVCSAKDKCAAPIQLEKSLGLKRNFSEDEEETDTVSSSQSNLKKIKSTQTKLELETQKQNYYKYFPFGEEDDLPCIIKIYEEGEKSEIILNDRIEVVGFLSVSPELEGHLQSENDEDKVLHLPSSLVPRIHAVICKKLKHYNPLLKQIISYDDIEHFIENARSDLHLILTQILFEDSVAADYLLCHLLSRIYIRNESHTIGKFSLNLFNINLQNFGYCVYNIIKKLVTNSKYVPLSVDLLNKASFIPKKNYDSNKLCSGMLQLCDDVHFILDETKMTEGQLNNIGCLNVAALQRLFRDQEVQYDFGYYSISYNANVPLLILSEGKSMFEADVRMKVKSESYTEANLSESYESACAYLNEEISNKIRIYLTAVRLRDFELGEDMVRKIGEDYVSMRIQDKKVNSSDLHTLLVLSRLLALSHGRIFLNHSDWNHAVEMETERKSRFI